MELGREVRGRRGAEDVRPVADRGDDGLLRSPELRPSAAPSAQPSPPEWGDPKQDPGAGGGMWRRSTGYSLTRIVSDPSTSPMQRDAHWKPIGVRPDSASAARAQASRWVRCAATGRARRAAAAAGSTRRRTASARRERHGRLGRHGNVARVGRIGYRE